MRCEKALLSLVLSLFCWAAWSQAEFPVSSLCDQGLLTLTNMERDNQLLKESIATLNADLLLDREFLKKCRENLTASNEKIASLELSLTILLDDSKKDEKSLETQKKLLDDQETAYRNLEKSLSLSRKWNKRLTVSLCVAVPALALETWLLLR